MKHCKQCGVHFVYDSELVRLGTQAIKKRFLAWRDPPVELPADSVIEKAVIEIAMLAGTYSEVEPDGRGHSYSEDLCGPFCDGIHSQKHRIKRLLVLVGRLLAKLPHERHDLSAGWCAGCGARHWPTFGEGQQPCKKDCVLLEAREALKGAEHE